MLTSYLRSGQTVDFAVANGKSITNRYIEMLQTGADLQKIETIKLTPLEALTLSDHLRQMAEYLHVSGYDYTESTQEETNDADGAGQTGTLGGEIRSGGEEGNKTCGVHSETAERGADHSADNLDKQTGSREDSRVAQLGPDPDDSILNLHPRAEQLLHNAGIPIPPVDMPNPLIVTSDGHVAKAPFGWDSVEGGIVNDNQLPEPPQVINVTADWDDPDWWQRQLDDFVDHFVIRAGKHDKQTANFRIIGSVDDAITMPLIVTNHPWLRSKAMRTTITEVFAQAFRFGASWENARD